MHWLDVEEIAETLLEEHPDIDPTQVTFTDLRDLVEELEDFEEQPGHPCNERILETIQGYWIKEREGTGGAPGTMAGLGDDDDDDV